MVFRDDGHLSAEALTALARNEDNFDGLERLEIAEHLAFCDECLQRYAMALEGGTLLIPERSCRQLFPPVSGAGPSIWPSAVTPPPRPPWPWP